jgi:hypothetical protein
VNLTPSVLPRRQTTLQDRAPRPSRENANLMLLDRMAVSSIVSFAPVAERSRTWHARVAKPPSRMIHPGCCTDRRTSRFFLSVIPSSAFAVCYGLHLLCRECCAEVPQFMTTFAGNVECEWPSSLSLPNYEMQLLQMARARYPAIFAVGIVFLRFT